METILADTDAVSYVFKHDTRGRSFAPILFGQTTAISFMTLAELRRWTLSRDWGPSRVATLESFLASFAVIWCDDALCDKWAEVVDGARRAGRPIQVADAWIAATALRYDLPLVTHNLRDYAGVPGLRLLTA